MSKKPSFSTSRRQQGQVAENIAATYLKKQGYTILHQNIYTPFGEIDILAKKKNQYYCIEVRSRGKHSQFDPLLSLTWQKYSNLVRSLLSLPFLHNKPAQIDLVTVEEGLVTHHLQAIDPPVD